jgi:acyl-coenzyme A thioesterase PaaI-like protein
MTTFTAEEAHQGFPGYLHGGIISTILDEVMSRVTVLDSYWSLTARLDVRFREPVKTGEAITAIGEQVCTRGKFVKTRGKVETPDGTVAADAIGRYAHIPNEVLTCIAAGYPRLRDEWMFNR